MHILYRLLCLGLFCVSQDSCRAAALTEGKTEDSPQYHITYHLTYHQMDEFDSFLVEAHGNDCQVMFPDSTTRRIFTRKNFETYAKECDQSGRPRRLVVGSGHNDLIAGTLGKSLDYFTVDLCPSNKPDIAGDVFCMESLIFQSDNWDFIIFECFPWGHNFTDENLKMIANSLRPNGVWLLPES